MADLGEAAEYISALCRETGMQPDDILKHSIEDVPEFDAYTLESAYARMLKTAADGIDDPSLSDPAVWFATMNLYWEQGQKKKKGAKK